MSRPAYSAYAFLHARLGALRAGLLTPWHWDRLLRARTFAEQRQVLEPTSYAGRLGESPEAAPGRLRAELWRTAAAVERSLSRAAARFIRTWGDRDLLRNVKTVLRGKALGRPEDAVAAELIDPGPAPRVPLDRLLGSPGVEAALDLLEDTDLRHWVREARRLYRRDPSLFGLDAALDRMYYVALAREMDALAAADREAVADLVRREIDQVNLLWVMRYRLNYGLSPAEAYYLLTPVTGRLDAEQLKALARQDSLEAMLARIEAEPYRALAAGCTSVAQVEVALWRLRARGARRALRRAAFTLGEALALLELKQMEIRDLVAVVEGTRLGGSRTDVLEQLTLAA
jgi:V/A-type H+-transporting ATPase subunit C